MREILTQQLELIWSFATRYALDGLVDEAALWRPSDPVVTVHRTDAGWDRTPTPPHAQTPAYTATRRAGGASVPAFTNSDALTGSL